MDTIKDFINWAKNNDWEIIPGSYNANILPINIKNIFDRLDIPQEYINFLMKIGKCISKDGKIKFICIDDLLEMMKGNDEKTNEIKNYFDEIFPIAINTKTEEKYYAILMESDNLIAAGDFSTLYDHDPLALVGVVADNFEEFIQKIISKEIEL
jgi:hypothetical protein